MEIKDSVVLITGGSSGIGFATAKLLKEKGAKVAITGRDEKKLLAAAEELKVLPLKTDVSKEEDCVKMVQRVVDFYGDFHTLINNAGYGMFSPLLNTKLSDMQELYATNVFGAMLAARESAIYFVSKNRGNIINISSTAGRKGFAMGTMYSSSKFALTSMTECWREELRKYNIRVMQVNPSEVQTHFTENSGRQAKPFNASKLQGVEIAHVIASMLEMEDRGFITETTVFATNPIS